MKSRRLDSSAAKSATKRGVGFQAMALAGTTGIGQLIVALLYIWSARSAGPTEFGHIVTGIALGTASVGFLDFGTNGYWVREIASGKLTPTVFGRRLANKILITGVVAVVWVVLWTVVIPGTSLAIAGAILLSTLLNQSFQVGLRGMARADLVAISILADRIIALIVFCVLVSLSFSPVNALWIGLAVGSLAAATMGMIMTPKEFRPILRVSRKVNPWTGSGHFGIANAAISAQSFDTPILTVFGGVASAGSYAAVARWTQPMGLLANAFASATAPHIARAESVSDAWKYIRRSIWLPMIAIIVSLCMVFAAPSLVGFLVGPGYLDSVAVLQVLAIGTIPAIANQLLFVFLQASGLDRPVSYLAVGMVVVQLSLVALLSVNLGALGGALAAASSQVIMLCGLVAILVTYIRKKHASSNES